MSVVIADAVPEPPCHTTAFNSPVWGRLLAGSDVVEHELRELLGGRVPTQVGGPRASGVEHGGELRHHRDADSAQHQREEGFAPPRAARGQHRRLRVGPLPHASSQDADEFDAWMAAARASLEALTAAPDTGDRDWMEEQVEARLRLLAQLVDGAPAPDVETRHHFVELSDGRYQRHPARTLLEDQVTHPCPSPIHMFEECLGPVLIIFCTRSGWPRTLERAVEELGRNHENVTVHRLDGRHTAPVWLESGQTSEWIREFLAVRPG